MMATQVSPLASHYSYLDWVASARTSSIWPRLRLRLLQTLISTIQQHFAAPMGKTNQIPGNHSRGMLILFAGKLLWEQKQFPICYQQTHYKIWVLQDDFWVINSQIVKLCVISWWVVDSSMLDVMKGQRFSCYLNSPVNDSTSSSSLGLNPSFS